MKIHLLQRFGDHKPGETIDVDEVTGRWLVGINRGTARGVPSPLQGAAAPGGHGSDLTASAAPPRPIDQRAPRSHNVALPVPGSPLQYNAGVREGERNQSGRTAARQARAEALARAAAGPGDDGTAAPAKGKRRSEDS